MTDFKRYRVRTIDKTYDEPGPDLLRTKTNAVHQVGRNLGASRTGYYVRRDPAGKKAWTRWEGPFNRGPLLEKVSTWVGNAQSTAKLQIGRKVEGKVTAKHEVLVVRVHHVSMSGVNAGAELVADLNREQWGNKVNILGFSCRRFNNSTDPDDGWSDHAWGDAVDLVPQGNLSNDKLTDWNVRMAREGLMSSVDQFIGSKNGRVYSFVEPAYEPNLGGPPSHLTHVHCSYTQHFGADPNCR